jgi:putative membrane protein
MVFIDNLAYALFSVSFAGFMLLYTVSSMYLLYRKRRSFQEHLMAASLPIALIGLYMLVMGLWGQFTWPLPGSYNILFYDPFLSFGILLLSFSMAVRYRLRLEYVGFLGLMMGAMIIVYGIAGYNLGLTAAPIGLLALYLGYGLAAIFSYPVSLISDRLPDTRKRTPANWRIILIIFCILLLLASLVSAYTGFAAIGQHLMSAP